ncbi:cellulase family glycosylhydrolase [Methylobacterium hispanicum]|uniref:cellulase family glycosylhydrolase n=1 Tax=Methylobacterium hispanicum TaxID=270350 RepID=UPI002F34B02A
MKLGVNLAGADFGGGHLPGTLGTDYTYPTRQEIDYYAGKGMSVVRLPFLWERVQLAANGPLSTSELAQMDGVVAYAASRGLQVILEPHNFGSGYGHPVGSAETPDSAFADLWSRLARHYAGSPNVIFGLMNEPHQQTAQQWLGSANAAIAAIRATGAGQQILVPGSYWTGAHSWVSTDNDTVIGPGIRDPLRNFAFEVHQYLDSDSSGTHANVVSANIGVERLTAVTQWAEATGSRLFLGEFGVAQDPVSLAALANMVAYMKAHPVWEGATYWAAGPWWGDYMFSIEPTGLGTGSVVDRPQMDVLEAFLGAVTGGTTAPGAVPGGTAGPGGVADAIPVGTPGPDRAVLPMGRITYRGGAGDDTVTGSADDDLIYGNQGDDRVAAGTGAGAWGRDTVFGGQGQDALDWSSSSVGAFIYGNMGKDTLTGGAGDDVLYGGQGQDRIAVGAGDNLAYGNLGDDTILGGPGRDTLFGGQGQDVITAAGTAAAIYGNLGDDLLRAGAGADTLYGGQGADTLVAGAGTALLVGGLGADLYLVGPGTGRVRILGFAPEGGDRIGLGGQGYALDRTPDGDARLVLAGGGTVDLAGIRPEQVGAGLFA